ncbi:hypothetical protein OYT88_11915 [Sporolactobacillus sp. CQH2019]|uniref:hypothetical protein n=1 Tax=Sporolactobacillus sp. CQH2019 TaxID=3023512 RepID=UPI002367B77B|nr:hypothetical protein [Sporolactobacillus sp. CQH2019]MDD9149260.1 hypothetical protein [Sporolactobacillus sp. CQH2019]
MEKAITIDGKSVRLKTSGAFPMRFQTQFHKDYFKELLKIAPLGKLGKKKQFDLSDLEKIDFDLFYDIIWTMAKTADPSIPEPLTWLDGFEEFPIIDIISEIQDMLMAMLQTKKKV